MSDELTPEDDYLEAIAADGYAVSAEPLHEHPAEHHRPLLLPVLGAAGVGFLLACQGRINGQLAHETGDGILAAVISFAVGLVILLAVCIPRRSTRTALRRTLPAQVRGGGLRWWQLIGGCLGAVYVASQGLTIPSLGVALFTVLVVAGTTGSSLLVDELGIGPGGRRPVTRMRVVAAGIVVLAVVVAVSGRFSTGTLALYAVLLAVLSGALMSYQQAINGQVAMRAGDPLVATLLNFVLGLATLLVFLGIEHLLLGRSWQAPPSPLSEPLLWSGGALGVAFILVSSLVVRPLGVLLYSLLSIGGQLTAALLLDLVVPTTGTVVGWQLVVGVLMTFGAVSLAALRR